MNAVVTGEKLLKSKLRCNNVAYFMNVIMVNLLNLIQIPVKDEVGFTGKVHRVSLILYTFLKHENASVDFWHSP